MVYLILFSSALLSATLLPIGSELLLIYDIQSGHHLGLLLLCATLGNVLGSVINYFLGLKGEAYCEKKGYLTNKLINIQDSFLAMAALLYFFLGLQLLVILLLLLLEY